MLEHYLKESSMDVVNDAEYNLMSDEPEALMRIEIGMMKERLAKRLMSLGFCQQKVEKLAECFRRLSFSDRNDGK